MGNWRQWSFKIKLLVDKTGVRAWLAGTQPRPDPTLYPEAYWEDLPLRAFIIDDVDDVITLDTAYEVYEQLRKHHKRQGLWTQLLLLKEAFEIRFDPTLNELKQAYSSIYGHG